MEGTVQISIKDFEKLRDEADKFKTLRNQLNKATIVTDVETNKNSDVWIQEIKINARRVAEIAADFADIEGRYETDRIVLFNTEEMEME